MQKITLSLLSSLLLVTACSSNSDKENGALADMPQWYLNPAVKGHWSDAQCVPFSGRISADEREARLIATQSLALRIEQRFSSLEEARESKTSSNRGVNTGAHTEVNLRGLVNSALQGIKVEKRGLFELQDSQQFCVLVTLPNDNVKNEAEKLAAAFDGQLDANDETIIFEGYKAEAGQKRLRQSVENN